MHYYILSKPDVPRDLEHAGYLCSLMEGNESAKQTALLGKKESVGSPCASNILCA
jgi:hypothetical protein